MEMSQKITEIKHQHLFHHDLIKLIVVYSLNHLRILVLWNKFVGMDRENFIEKQTLTQGETLASSVGGRDGNTKEEEGEKSKKEEETKLE